MDAKKALALGMKRLRERSGLSQAKLAERVGVSVQHLAAIEQARKEPSLATLSAIASALRVPLRVLFPEESGQRSPIADDVAALVRGLDPEHQRRVLVIVREVCAVATGTRRTRK